MKSQEYKTLYRPQFEHDNCGIGVIVDIKGRQSYTTVDNTLKIVENLEHRAGKDAEGKTGDGVGILLQISQFLPCAHGGAGGRDRRRERIWYRYVLLPSDRDEM